MKTIVGIGLLGCGTVGASVADRLQRERDEIERRCGIRYELRGIAIRDPDKQRPASLRRDRFSCDARAVVDDPEVDLIVELIGGVTEAAELVERALERGRHVVTANKDLLGTQGPRLATLAASRGAALRYEAAVGGAIPVLRVLRDGLAGDRVSAVAGVLNGTCTSILSAMEDGAEYADALADAQRLGYAEADPSNDVEGTDAAHKLALLMQTAFGIAATSPRVPRAGITGVTRRDVARARMLGLRIRLVACATHTSDGVRADVEPVLLPQAHPFAQTAGADNVVRILARDAGTLELRGTGAGGPATASAVLADTADVLRAIVDRREFAHRHAHGALDAPPEILPMFSALPRTPELPQYPLWDDSVLHCKAPLSQQPLAYS